ncbi:unnamed protein product [Clonostachys byssicola]|uniref:Uncharacterized protein n=1 Tax=Clonostachys byssicola TaxID=160290 RepID=A0A9N9UM30_9HYPO|nr:unnamed protein product [Clonostachys byssicola]
MSAVNRTADSASDTAQRYLVQPTKKKIKPADLNPERRMRRQNEAEKPAAAASGTNQQQKLYSEWPQRKSHPATPAANATPANHQPHRNAGTFPILRAFSYESLIILALFLYLVWSVAGWRSTDDSYFA